MIGLLQRVREAAVEIGGERVARIGTGLLVLQGLVKLLEDIAVAFNLDYYTPQEPKSEGDQL